MKGIYYIIGVVTFPLAMWIAAEVNHECFKINSYEVNCEQPK